MSFNFKQQAPITPIPAGTINLAGKTALITGSNQGMGYEAARLLLKLNASTVILAVRNVRNGNAARESLLADPEIKSLKTRPVIKVMEVDMSDYASVVSFANNLGQERLDIALLNAGCGQLNYEVAKTGHEKVYQVNHLSNALLSLRLLPLLEKTASETGVPSRLSWVGSRAQEMSSFINKRPFKEGTSILERMDDKKTYSGMTVYGDSKTLVALWVRELASRVSSKKVIINNMCPGGVNTMMSSVLPTPIRQLMKMYQNRYHRSPEVGAWINVYGLVATGEETHGRFLKDKTLVEPLPYYLTPEGKALQKAVWEESLADVKKADPSIDGSIF